MLLKGEDRGELEDNWRLLFYHLAPFISFSALQLVPTSHCGKCRCSQFLVLALLRNSSLRRDSPCRSHVTRAEESYYSDGSWEATVPNRTKLNPPSEI